MPDRVTIDKAYNIAREQYAELGVDTDKAIEALKSVSLSIHCWQGDDVGGFETSDSSLSGGGIQVTGNYPGKARTIDELRSDLRQAYALIPGSHRLNLHAIYGEFGGRFVDRDAVGPEHFEGWVDWSKENNLKLDFNSSCFSHPKASSGFTLSDYDKSVRKFWIEHVKRCREISAYMGKELGDACIHNLWIPDGAKDVTVDRALLRRNLLESLDEVYSTAYDKSQMKDAVECKLFGIGSEYYVVGSHEFYMGYAMTRDLMICLDLGHFHPTESVADKISALLPYYDELLLHLSRGIRWDSDHVVVLNDETRNVMEEVVRNDALGRIHLALDYFDGSINRIGAWVIGARSTLKGILNALLEPREMLVGYETNGKNFERLAMLEEAKTMPIGAVWDYYCTMMDVPAGSSWIKDVQDYESAVIAGR